MAGNRGRSGSANPNWRGGRSVERGRPLVRVPPDHPRARGNGYIYEYRLIAERALGRPLPQRVNVHHRNGDPADSRPENLVICEDVAYHRIIEARERAYRATGSADALRCEFCGEYDYVENLVTRPRRGTKVRPHAHHRDCRNAYRRRRGRGS